MSTFHVGKGVLREASDDKPARGPTPFAEPCPCAELEDTAAAEEPDADDDGAGWLKLSSETSDATCLSLSEGDDGPSMLASLSTEQQQL